MAGNNLVYNLDVDTRQASEQINSFFAGFKDNAAQAKNALNQAFGQSVQTSVKIEFKNGELVAKQIQNINQESNKLGTVWKAVNGDLGKTPNALKQQLSILKNLRDDTQKYSTGTKTISKDWETLTGKIREAQRALNEMTKGNALQQLGSAVQGLAGRFALVQTLANGLTNALSSVGQGAVNFVKTGAELQVLGLQLEAFTGSSESADIAFKQFQQTAAKTKFNVEEVAKAGQILLAYGVDTKTAIEATKNLSIAASATGGDVGLLARNLGQAASQGRAYTRDLIQFAIQGIPIWDELAIVTGKSTAELKELAKEGQIGFNEVNQAIKNLTQEGSAFAEVADRIQETFIGQFRVLESAVQTLAKKFVETASAVDRAFGAPVAKSIGLLAGLINGLADNWKTITTLIVSATAATVAFIVASNFGAILGFVRGLITAYNAWRASISATAVAQAVLQGLMGNWAAIASALAAGTVVAIGLNEALKNQTTAAIEAAGGADQLAGATGELSDKQLEAADSAGANARALKTQYLEAQNAANTAKESLDLEIEKLKELQKQVEARYKEEIDSAKEKQQLIKDQMAEEKERIQGVKEKMKERYDAEREALKDKLDKVREIYDAEIAGLEARTPAEEKLRQLQKEELQAKIQSGQLNAKETLEAQAQLERMLAQDKIQELKNKKKAEETKITDQLAAKEKEYKANIEAAEKASDARLESMKRALKESEGEIKAMETAMKDTIKEIENAISVTGKQKFALAELPGEINKQINAVNEAKLAYDRTKASVDSLASSLRAATSAAQALKNVQASSTTVTGRASGGPVTGGSTYTVNELGKEAFLSASGRLSMINAPSWGQWTAPGAGTVIPAHLTKQLNIPAGGVSLNSGAAMSASRADGGGMRGMMKALMSIGGGDSIQNNVTIQAANTTQAASDMLVSLTKIKRRRYS